MSSPKYSDSKSWPKAIAKLLDLFSAHKESARLAANDLLTDTDARLKASAAEGAYAYAELRLRTTAIPSELVAEISGLRAGACQRGNDATRPASDRIFALETASCYADIEAALRKILGAKATTPAAENRADAPAVNAESRRP